MSTIHGIGFIKHLRAEPNQFILHYANGKLTKKGVGLAYWFNPLSASIACVPVEDLVTTTILKERTSDFQLVSVQLTLTYRIVDPEKAAMRVNFGISLSTGAWLDTPLEHLAGFWQQRVQEPARNMLARTSLVEALKSAPERIRSLLQVRFHDDGESSDMGLALVSLEIDRVAPSPELDKALQTPARELLQQKADEALFQRRALAVENERAIKENEMQTQIELARREEQLITEQGNNRLLDIRQAAAAEREQVQAELERKRLEADAYARDVEARATGDAQAQAALAEAEAEGEAKRFAVWEGASKKVLLGLALREFAGKIDHIQHLNLSPNVLGDAFHNFLTSEAER